MTDSAQPPFRAEHVGSLLRPAALREAFRAHQEGRLDPRGFRAAQDAAIRDAVALQERLGLHGITDGEFRRASYWAHFVEATEGLGVAPARFRFHDDAGHQTSFLAPRVTDRLRRARPISGDELGFLRSVVSRTPKITLPSPPTMHFWAEPSSAKAAGYPDDEAYLFAMHRAVAPVGEARDDHAIFAALARRLGFEERFTEGRDEMGWLRHIYDRGRQKAGQHGFELPDFDAFWRVGHLRLPDRERHVVMLEDFRADPGRNPLKTPSGRIEVFSETIAGFGYDDCLGHPAWYEPAEWLGSSKARRFPLHLISCQPAPRLHAQYDNGSVSRAAKVAGREPVWINPADAAARGIRDGDLVRLWNDRGQCLAGAVVGDAVRLGVVRLPTGAWYDPAEPGRVGALCRHGNPNVLTLDKGTSKLAQGPSAQTCLVDVEPWTGEPPAVGAFTPPAIVSD